MLRSKQPADQNFILSRAPLGAWFWDCECIAKILFEIGTIPYHAHQNAHHRHRYHPR